MNKSNARGRRPGSPDTRTQILRVARRRFLEDGYTRVTLRSIASEAAVDVALISYFFGSKHGLLIATLELAADPATLLAAALEGPPQQLGHRIVHTLVTTWDDPERGASLRMMVRAAVADDEIARLLREMVTRELLGRVAERVGGEATDGRIGAVATSLVGLIVGRYVLFLEPVASMPVDELTRRVGPMLQAALAPRRDDR